VVPVSVADDVERRLAKLPQPAIEAHALTIDEYYALEELKAELWGGYLDDKYLDVWLKLVLVNAGLRAAVRLAPRELWLEALE
jgi:hypothetical protein